MPSHKRLRAEGSDEDRASDRDDGDDFEATDAFFQHLEEQERFWAIPWHDAPRDGRGAQHDLEWVLQRFNGREASDEAVLDAIAGVKRDVASLYREAIASGASDARTMEAMAAHYAFLGYTHIDRADLDHEIVTQRVTKVMRVMDTSVRLMESALLLRAAKRGAQTVRQMKDVFSQVTFNAANLRRSGGPVTESTSDDEAGDAGAPARGKPKEGKLSDFQKLLLYLLDQICIHQYRRGDHGLYRQVMHDGAPTHAWTRECSIAQFIQSRCPKELRGEYWLMLTSSPRMSANLEEHLTHCHDAQLQEVRTDRHVFSFFNGVLVCNHRDAQGRLAPRFYPYTAHIPPDTIACKFHELRFPEEHVATPFMQIPTPALSGMLDTQRLSADVQCWLWVFLGRMMFATREADDWQVAPFIKGVAGSGKSTIIHEVISRFYEPEDVFMLSNNVERKFGLQNALKSNGAMKRICLMPEVKQDVGLEQAEWQMMVSGERIPINRKNQTTAVVDFDAPLFAAGNQMLGFSDNSNSMARRVPVIKFGVSVGGRQDADLPRKLRQELAFIMLKASLAYAWAANAHGRDSIWSALPREFLDEQQRLLESQHSLVNFLMSGKVTVHETAFVPQKLFVQAFRAHVAERCLKSPVWNADFYETAFGERGIRVEKRASVVYEARAVTSTVLFGVDLVDDDGIAPSSRR